MKKTFLVLGLTSILFQVNAFASMPKEISNLSNKTGILSTSYNGKIRADDTGIGCAVLLDDSESISIDSNSIYKANAFLKNASVKSNNLQTEFVTTESGRRQGGSVCGDSKPLTSYKKTVIVTKNSLTIKEKYSCLVFDRNEIVQTCNFK